MTVERGTIIHLADDGGVVTKYVVSAIRHSPIDYAELRPVQGGVPIAVRFSLLDHRHVDSPPGQVDRVGVSLAPGIQSGTARRSPSRS